MRFPTPDDGENNTAYWRHRAEDAEATVRRVRTAADGWTDLASRMVPPEVDPEPQHRALTAAVVGTLMTCAEEAREALDGPK